MESTPSFYAVIPADVRYCQTIPDGAKLLYGEITALCNQQGFCWASNAYFAALYNCSTDTISRWVGALSKAEFIRSEVDKSRANTRKIYIQTIRKNADTLSAKMPIPIRKNAEYNSTLNKTVNKSTITTAESEISPVDTNPSTPPIFPAAPPASPHPVGNLAEWLQSVRADSFIRETFTRARKVPANLFDQYFDLFHLEANTKPEEYHRRKDVVEHFLNYAAAKHRIESKPAPQPVNRFNQPEPAPAYKPPKPIAEMPEPKYRTR
jgi:hypothetical protein